MPTLNDLKQRKQDLQQRYAHPLCAGCGEVIRPDYWQPPETSLCPECEDKVRQGQVSWPEIFKQEQAGT